MALKNQALTIPYLAWNTSTNQPATGDAAQHALRLVQDGAKATPAASAAEVSAAECPGVYTLAASAAEMNFNVVTLCGSSSTASVVLIPTTVVTERGVLPAAAPGATGGLLTLGTGAGQMTVDGTTGGIVLAAAGADAVKTEGSLNLPQTAALILDILAAIRSGVPAAGSGGTITVKDPSGTNTRAAITVDAAGNITASTLTPPST